MKSIIIILVAFLSFNLTYANQNDNNLSKLESELSTFNSSQELLPASLDLQEMDEETSCFQMGLAHFYLSYFENGFSLEDSLRMGWAMIELCEMLGPDWMEN